MNLLQRCRCWVQQLSIYHLKVVIMKRIYLAYRILLALVPLFSVTVVTDGIIAQYPEKFE